MVLSISELLALTGKQVEFVCVRGVLGEVYDCLRNATCKWCLLSGFNNHPLPFIFLK